MAAPRATQFLALRNLTRSASQVRSLHMTGPATYASPLHANESPVTPTDLPRDPSTRPTPSTPASPPTTRHINTSRTLKAIHDTSTIDFAHFPDTSALFPAAPETFRVPILPDNATPQLPPREPDDVPVMKPEISTMSADAVFLPMADMHDGHAMNVDFHAMADKVAMELRRAGLQSGGKVTAEEQASVLKRVWGDLVDDVVRGLGKVGKA